MANLRKNLAADELHALEKFKANPDAEPAAVSKSDDKRKKKNDDDEEVVSLSEEEDPEKKERKRDDKGKRNTSLLHSIDRFNK